MVLIRKKEVKKKCNNHNPQSCQKQKVGRKKKTDVYKLQSSECQKHTSGGIFLSIFQGRFHYIFPQN